jgi:sugar phosphate isomerase/epimerase
MRLSCLPVSYFADILAGRMSVGQWAREAAEVGLDAIDLTVLFIQSDEPRYLQRMRQEIETSGVRVAMVAAYPDFTHPDPDERERQAHRLEGHIASSAALGAELVRVTAGQAHPGTSREAGISWAIKGLTEALPAAERYGVQLVYENHSKPGVWDYFDFSYPSDVFLAIVEGTAGTSLGVNFDTANPLVQGDDPVPLLQKVLGRVVSVHAADTRAPGSLDPVVIGTGATPFPEIFSTLQAADFDGWICIEEASRTGRAGVEQAAAFIRRLWHEQGGHL